MNAAQTLLSGLIDYAGLFPPASLEMEPAAAAYAAYLTGDDKSMLGRFVIPASRLEEFSSAVSPFLKPGGEPWRLSVIANQDVLEVREKVLHFNCSHAATSDAGHAVCDAIEIPVATVGEIDRALELFPGFFDLFLEVQLNPGPEALIGAMSGTRAAAKMRAGGIVPDSIPDSSHVLRFLRACHMHRVRFKATAGLHHALRGPYALTYEPMSPVATMFGYLNIFIASALLEQGISDEDLVGVLEEADASAFVFRDARVTWRSHSLSVDELRQTRSGFATSFGSCSFTEPLAEARALGLI